MTTTRTAPATVNTSNTVHLATIFESGSKGIDCGAIRFRNTTAARINIQPEGTAITCTKCLKNAPAPVVEPAPARSSHAGHDHPATKAARAACRKAAKA